MGVRLERTEDHRRFEDFYERSGLEIDKSGWLEYNRPVRSVAAWEDGQFRGAATVSHRFGKYILDYIAVSEDSRGRGLGRLLAEDCLEQCRDAGCGEVFLAAREPLFFRALGAVPAGTDELLEECRGCRDYMKSCRPVEMKFVL